MGLFNRQICVHCGKPCNMLTRKQLKDKKYICGECAKKCPDFFVSYCLSGLTYNEYVAYLKHREENRKKLADFNITDVYFNSVFVDMEKGWMTFSHYGEFHNKEGMLRCNPDIFDVSKMVYGHLLYTPKDVKEGMFNDKLLVDIKLVIAFDDPWYPVSFANDVAYNHKLKVEEKGILLRECVIRTDPMHEQLVTYLTSVLLENNVNIPYQLGSAITTKFDFTPYDTYLKKLFSLIDMLVYSSKEEDELLKEITSSSVLRHRLKSTYGK